LGTSKHLENVIREHNVDELLVLNSDFSKSEMYHIWEISRIYGVRYRYMTHTFDITKTNTSLSLLYQIPTVEINTTPLQNWNRIIKRIFDICLSFCILVIISPVLVIIALLIKFEDPHGPVIYKNIRI